MEINNIFENQIYVFGLNHTRYNFKYLPYFMGCLKDLDILKTYFILL